jgi:serine/threonine protein kinase
VNPARYSRLKEIVLTAAALAGPDRDTYLDGACGGDAVLRGEAEALLALHGPTASAIRTGALDDALASAVREALPARDGGRDGNDDGAHGAPARLPERVGPYRVIGLLGEGGMGSVYRARQEEPVRRDVAVKLIRGAESGPVLARFESERQALAQMNHPGIARLLDAGATTNGHPWFAMELVEGAPITTFARGAGLDTTARLRLVLDVCRAVRHAHRKGIIHRDLKPSNILVTLVQDRPHPKIIDFSIARALGGSLVGETYRTRTGQIVGTVEYMSPEQARGETAHVDTRSDVYALGVLLYELLADRLPYEIVGRPLHEAVRAIVDTPPRPLRATGATGRTSRRLDPDVETIVHKCLEKDPDRRYGSAAELTEDLERLLSARPILARPPSTLYQLRKLVARHKAVFTATAAVILALAAGVVGTTIGLVRATRGREEARQETAAAEQAMSFLLKVFEVSDPSEARGRTVTAREILDKGAGRVREELAGQPRLQARMMSTLGTVYLHLGLYETARPLLEEALVTQRRVIGSDHPETLATIEGLGWLDYQTSQMEEAEALLREAADRSRRVLPADSEDTLDRVNYLAVTLWKEGHLEEARALFAANLEVERRLYGEENPITMKTTNNLGIIYGSMGRLKEAEPLFARTLEIRRKLYGTDHPLIVTAARNLAKVYEGTGRLEEASALYEEVLGICRRIYGEEHPETLHSMGSLAGFYGHSGRFQEAEDLILRTIAIQKRTLGDSNHEYADSLYHRSEIYAAQGKLTEAERSFEETYDAYKRALGPRGYDTCLAERSFGMSAARVGHFDRARRIEEDALACVRETAGPRSVPTADTLAATALVEVLAGDMTAARDYLEQSIQAGKASSPLLAEPEWDRVREDPGLADLLASMGTATEKAED